ncbi:hypothetical protein NDU88_007035 [Pleurodeles waltl]|uniref:Uncharacterized protein n=1 Tax=Pleurodeles waltl TaxID=8319 RepID=A0AAV7RR71_PLEWA|nr:hypothetical protein NDU88_007035 [Pleurodeles waltl]
MGAQAVIAHARVASGCNQARPPLEKGGGRVAVPLKGRTLGGALKMAASSGSDWSMRGALEERTLGVASKMAAPITIDENEIAVISDDDKSKLEGQEEPGAQVFGGSGFVVRRGAGRKVQLVSRLVSPMIHKVQSWQKDNEAVVGLGEQVDLVDGSGSLLRGKVCGEAIVDRSVGKAYVSLDVSQPVAGEGTHGCGTPYALGGHGAKAIYLPSGRMVGDRSMPVKARAPSEHQTEERVRSRAVRLTSGDCTRASEVQPSTSQGAGVGWADWEELLDYDEDLEEPGVSTKRVMVVEEVPGVVQGGHVPVRAAGNLPRGEESVVEFLRAQRGWDNVRAVSRARALKGMVVGELGGKVDASIQVSPVKVDGKSQVSVGNGDGSSTKLESGDGAKSGAALAAVRVNRSSSHVHVCGAGREQQRLCRGVQDPPLHRQVEEAKEGQSQIQPDAGREEPAAFREAW